MKSPFLGIDPPSSGANGWGINLGDPNLNLATIIVALLPYIFGVAGIILVFMIISSGYQMMMSKGDPKVMQTAQGKLTTSLIGVLILFVSFFVVQLILKFLGLDIKIFG